MVLSGLNTFPELLTSYQQVINTALMHNLLILNKLKTYQQYFALFIIFIIFVKIINFLVKTLS